MQMEWEHYSNQKGNIKNHQITPNLSYLRPQKFGCILWINLAFAISFDRLNIDQANPANQAYYSEFERHNAEIAAYHVDRWI